MYAFYIILIGAKKSCWRPTSGHHSSRVMTPTWSTTLPSPYFRSCLWNEAVELAVTVLRRRDCRGPVAAARRWFTYNRSLSVIKWSCCRLWSLIRTIRRCYLNWSPTCDDPNTIVPSSSLTSSSSDSAALFTSPRRHHCLAHVSYPRHLSANTCVLRGNETVCRMLKINTVLALNQISAFVMQEQRIWWFYECHSYLGNRMKMTHIYNDDDLMHMISVLHLSLYHNTRVVLCITIDIRRPWDAWKSRGISGWRGRREYEESLRCDVMISQLCFYGLIVGDCCVHLVDWVIVWLMFSLHGDLVILQQLWYMHFWVCNNVLYRNLS